MIIIKIINLTLIVLVCTKMGFIKAELYKERVIKLNKFREALSYLKSKISFTYEPIKNIFKDMSNVIYNDDINVFKLASESLNFDFYSAWVESVNESSSFLKNDDLEIIKSFGKLLGKTDLEGQINEIELTMILIDKQIKDAEEELNKNNKLYKSMGIIVGVTISIILV